jgi:glycosyltransferase involved in cell wall biosynthesis
MSDQEKRKPWISAILITRDEAYHLKNCIESLDFCDEVVVVDHGSVDNTVAIAMNMGARVVTTSDWPGFGIQKQRALKAAKGTWVLSIDADERVTPNLRAEILKSTRCADASGFYIKRRSRFLGRWMRFGGWYPDYVLRLAKRDLAHFDPIPVHEKLLVKGNTTKLDGNLLHFSYQSIEDILEKQKKYALLSATQMREKQGAQTRVFIALLRSLWTFCRLYLVQLGFLDGRQGLISAIFKAQGVFWKYVAVEFDVAGTHAK